MGLGVLVQLLPTADRVVLRDADRAAGQVEVLPTELTQFTAPGARGDGQPQEHRQQRVELPRRRQQPRDLRRRRGLGLDGVGTMEPGSFGRILLNPLPADSRGERAGQDRVDLADRAGRQRRADVVFLTPHVAVAELPADTQPGVQELERPRRDLPGTLRPENRCDVPPGVPGVHMPRRRLDVGGRQVLLDQTLNGGVGLRPPARRGLRVESFGRRFDLVGPFHRLLEVDLLAAHRIASAVHPDPEGSARQTLNVMLRHMRRVNARSAPVHEPSPRDDRQIALDDL